MRNQPARFIPPAAPEAEIREELEDLPEPAAPLPAPLPAAPAPAVTSDPARRFEYGQGPAARFWEVARQGSTVALRFGAVGGAKQTKSEAYATDAEARAAVEEMIAEKFEDGFTELVSPTGAAPAALPVEEKAAKPKAAPAKAVALAATALRRPGASAISSSWRGHRASSGRCGSRAVSC